MVPVNNKTLSCYLDCPAEITHKTAGRKVYPITFNAIRLMELGEATIVPILNPITELLKPEIEKLIQLASPVTNRNVELIEYIGTTGFRYKYKTQNIGTWAGFFTIDCCNPKQFIYLLSLKIDVFGWIPAGFAHNAQTFLIV